MKRQLAGMPLWVDRRSGIGFPYKRKSETGSSF